MSREAPMLPVWFFIGVLLSIYGVIILITALGELSHPPEVVLAQYRPALFAAVLLLSIGGFYTFWFWPGRRKKK